MNPVDHDNNYGRDDDYYPDNGYMEQHEEESVDQNDAQSNADLSADVGVMNPFATQVIPVHFYTHVTFYVSC